MPVQSKHPQYEKFHEQWTKCRDVIAGEDAVKKAGARYLPSLQDQMGEDFEAYTKRASMYEATKRTVQGLVGAILRKDPAVVFPNEDLLTRIGGADVPFSSIISQTAEQTIGIGRVGLLVDADAETENAEPYISIYFAENIINWKTAVVDGQRELILLVLEERFDEDDEEDEDGFSLEEEVRYRVYRLVEPNSDAQHVEVEIWERDEPDDKGVQSEEFHKASTTTPKMSGGLSLKAIPFEFINPGGVGPDCEESPLLGLVNMNLAHYRNSADLEHGLHFTALPTPWASGFDIGKSGKLHIGSMTAWIASDPGASAGFLEFSGAGLASLTSAMEKKEQLMAVLGARMLEAQKAGVEAADTVQLRQAGETSVLSKLADAVALGLVKVLKWVAEWSKNADGNISIELNKDFNPTTVDGPTLLSWMQACQGGLMSWDVFYFNCERAEMYPEDWTAEKEKAKIAESGPMRLPGQNAQDGLGGGGAGGSGGNDPNAAKGDPTANNSQKNGKPGNKPPFPARKPPVVAKVGATA